MYIQASASLIIDQWIYVIVTFQKNQGVLLYYDAKLRSANKTGLPVSDTRPVDTDKNLLIGRNIEGPPYHYAAFDMASLTIFPEFLNENDVEKTFLFFWTEASKCRFHAEQ